MAVPVKCVYFCKLREYGDHLWELLSVQLKPGHVVSLWQDLSAMRLVIAWFVRLLKQRRRRFPFIRFDPQLCTDLVICYLLYPHCNKILCAEILRRIGNARKSFLVPTRRFRELSRRYMMYQEGCLLQRVRSLQTRYLCSVRRSKDKEKPFCLIAAGAAPQLVIAVRSHAECG